MWACDGRRRVRDSSVSPTLTSVPLQGDKNLITFEGGHNTVRSQFFFDSVSIFFLNTLHPPGAPMPSPPVRGGEGAEAGPGFQPISAELEMLLCMGFPRHVAERALRRHRTVELASNWLVENAENGWAELMESDGGFHARTEVEVVEAAEPRSDHLRTAPDAYSGELAAATPFKVQYEHVTSPRASKGAAQRAAQVGEEEALEDLADDELARAIELSFGSVISAAEGGGKAPGGGAGGGAGAAGGKGGGGGGSPPPGGGAGAAGGGGSSANRSAADALAAAAQNM